MQLIATQAIVCLLCFDIIHDRQLCACRNVGVILDDDEHLHVYVEEIKTTQRALLYHIGDFKEIRRVLLQPFSKALFAPYEFYDEPFYLKPKVPKDNYVRITSTSYDTTLISALDRYMYKTSDGNERFLRNATNDPKKPKRK